MTSVVLSNVRWSTYESLLLDLSDSSSTQLTFDQGLLEIEKRSLEDEVFNRTLNLIVEIVAAELDVHVEALGSTTFRRKDIQQGFDPDSWFYVAKAARGRRMERIDLPPDLVVEIDITRSSIPKMPVLARLGVPEVWRHDGTSFRIYELQGYEYVAVDQSLAFPVLTSHVLEDFLAKRQEWEDHPRLVRFIRDWVAANR